MHKDPARRALLLAFLKEYSGLRIGEAIRWGGRESLQSRENTGSQRPLSLGGLTELSDAAAQTALNAACRLELSQSGDSDSLVEVAGTEPAGAGDGTSANKRDSAHSTEALIKILTNLTDEDRQMPKRIVERWGSLSNYRLLHLYSLHHLNSISLAGKALSVFL